MVQLFHIYSATQVNIRKYLDMSQLKSHSSNFDLSEIKKALVQCGL